MGNFPLLLSIWYFNAFCTFLGTSFFRLGIFFPLILLKIFFVSFTWISSASSIPIIHSLCLFILFQIWNALCWDFFNICILFDVFIFSTLSSMHQSLSSVSYTLFIPWVYVCFFIFFISSNKLIGILKNNSISLLNSTKFQVLKCFHYFISLFVCAFYRLH